MPYKRIIGVLTVEDGRVVKSYGYTARRPAGGLVSALKNLDRWAADEIVVLDISRRGRLDPAVLQQIAKAKISTPLAYGGGIRSIKDVRTLMDLGCDRFVVESVLFDQAENLQAFAALAGRQALIGSVPVRFEQETVSLWRPGPTPEHAGGWTPLAPWVERLASSPVSEFLITSVPTEGHAGKFPVRLLDALSWLPEGSAIVFGGLDQVTARAALDHRATSAVAWGNINHEMELALPNLRSVGMRRESESIVRTIRLP
jgi:cyclase